MVTGGTDGRHRLEYTEVYGDDRVWKTVSGKLPTGGFTALRATTIGDRVFLFGKNYHFTMVFFLV